MFMMPSNLVFLASTALSTMMAISTASWVMAWICMEFNLMSLIPILAYSINFKTSSASIKYFLVQAMGSIVLFLAIVINYKYDSLNIFNKNEILTLSLAIKMGMPPFQFWVPQIIEAVSLVKSALILIWQKIAPMILITYSMTNSMLVMTMLSMVVGSTGGLNQNNIKKIFFYSSLMNLSWMINSALISEKVWALYLIVYTGATMPLLKEMDKNKIKLINKLTVFSYNSKMVLFIMMMTLTGMPPFISFYPKVMVIYYNLLTPWLTVMNAPLMITSVITVYFYFKMMWNSTMIMNSSNKCMKKKNNLSPMMLVASTLFPLVPICVI